jgi:hypothetical protein
MDIQEIFQTLNEKNVNEFTQKKGNFTYLSWAWAVRELLKVAPNATWVIHEYSHGNGETQSPYMRTGAGCFVKVTLTVDGIERTQIHPVLDNRNQTIDEPNAFQINTSIQRCLTKAIALHGLGLYIYAGEDLPVDDPVSPEEEAELVSIATEISEEMEEQVSASLNSGNINRSNYSASKAKLERLAKVKTNDKSE